MSIDVIGYNIPGATGIGVRRSGTAQCAYGSRARSCRPTSSIFLAAAGARLRVPSPPASARSGSSRRSPIPNVPCGSGSRSTAIYTSRGPARRRITVSSAASAWRRLVGPEHCFTPIPEGIGVGRRCSAGSAGFATALAGFERGGFRPGVTVAINGAAGVLGTSAALVAMAIGAAEMRLVSRRSAILNEVAALDRRLVVEAEGDDTPLDFVLDCSGGENAAPRRLFPPGSRGSAPGP